MKKREKSFIYYILVGLVCITIIVAFIFGEKVVLFTATIILTIFAFWGDNISNFKFLDKLSALIRTIINKILEITLKNLENYSDSIRKILPPKDNNVYHDLAPVDDVSGKSGYFRALDWALNNKKICNIAISAPYGAGKSSVINSYINNRKIKALQISLTNFSGTAMKPNEIEKAFLEKLFYKVKNSRIPESRFRKLHRISNIKVLINILLLITLSNHEDIIENILSKETFRVLSLSSEQVRLLYSLELVATTKDIEHTVNQKTKEKKQMWLNSWKELIVSGIGLNVDDYYVTDEKLIYDAINSIPQTVDNLRCFYLVTSEFIAYTPYFPLNSREDAEYKKLRLEKYNYIDDQFSRKQTIVSQAEIDGIRNSYKKYKGLVSGNTQNAMIAAGVVTVTAEHLILHLKINVNSCSHFEEAYEINRFFNSEGFILIAKDINTLFMDKGSTQKWRNNCYQSIKNDFEDYVGIMKAVLFFVDINYVGDRKRKIRKNDILPFEIPDITSVVDAIKHKEHHFKYKRIKLVVSKISRWRDLAILDANDYSFSDKEKILLDGSLSKVGYMKCINNSILKFKYSTLAKQYNYESVLQKNIDEMVLLADGSKWGFLEQKLKTDFDNEDIEIAGWLNDSKDIDD